MANPLSCLALAEGRVVCGAWVGRDGREEEADAKPSAGEVVQHAQGRGVPRMVTSPKHVLLRMVTFTKQKLMQSPLLGKWCSTRKVGGCCVWSHCPNAHCSIWSLPPNAFEVDAEPAAGEVLLHAQGGDVFMVTLPIIYCSIWSYPPNAFEVDAEPAAGMVVLLRKVVSSVSV